MNPKLPLAATFLLATSAAAQNLTAPADYPPEALRHHWEGVAYFTVTVMPDGRVGDCTITQSSGYAVLDEATCSTMKQRALFKPARDSAGNPIESLYSSKISWKIPR